MKKVIPLKVRISVAMEGHVSRNYWTLMHDVFPEPKAWRSAVQGGPPGCAMAFGRALRELGARWDQDNRCVHFTPAMRQLGRKR